MPALSWDQLQDRRFETGVDRGVLYVDGQGVAWNGLRSVEEESNRDAKSFYQDGIKYLEHQTIGEFSGTLKAFTYPDEFEEIVGALADPTGFYVHEQRAKSFGLSYRTRIGDANGPDFAYRIHILYNLRAIPLNTVFATVDSSIAPIEFGWKLSSTPVVVPGFRPTAHLSIKSTDMDPARLTRLEEGLYGGDNSSPNLPPMAELLELITVPVPPPLRIIDNGDGTWSASGAAVGTLTGGRYQIVEAPTTYSDDDTFTIPTTS